MSNVIVIGAGAAGCMAAVTAAERGHRVTVLEKNEKTGKKIYITGKGRCNFTNDCTGQEMLANVLRNPKFLYSAEAAFSSSDAIRFFERNGCPTKVERGNRAFPASDHASDIIKALNDAMRKAGVRVRYRTEVRGLLTEETETGKRITGVRTSDGDIACDAVVLATGGLSYPSTGSTGDGYRFAEELGLALVPTRPSLVQVRCKEGFIKDLEGLSLKNVTVTVKKGKKVLFKELGEMLFTGSGISGPLILTASGVCGDLFESQDETPLTIDLKPGMTPEEVEARLAREFSEQRHRAFKNVFERMFPKSLIPVFVSLTGIDPDKKAGDISKKEKQRVTELTKAFPLTVTGLAGYNEAVVTRGGISVKEIDPGTMEAKKVKGLFCAGEVLDLDARTGGFNLQIAWSTGYLAGMHIE